jgi:hypothetical protein
VGALKKNTSKRVSAYGTASWARLNRPWGTACKFAVLTQTIKPIVLFESMYGLKPVHTLQGGRTYLRGFKAAFTAKQLWTA